jgi:propanol-preferring alcohol dehydrogenase
MQRENAMTTMKAVRLVGAGRLELVELLVPEPGPGDVIIRVEAAGLCHSDLHMLHGIAPEQPFTLGHESAGRVVAFGPGVSGLREGDSVVVHGAWGCGTCANCADGMEQHCTNNTLAASGGLGRDGGLAEYLLVPGARHLVPLDGLDPVVAAPLDDAALTPYHAIKAALPWLAPDGTAVVIGIGGLGHIAVQLIRTLSGARVVAVDNQDQKLALALRVGADAVVAAGPKAVAGVLAEAGTRGVTFVLDCVGTTDTLEMAVAVAGARSRIVCVGVGGGAVPFNFYPFPAEATISSSVWGTVSELREVVALARSGRVTVFTETVSLEGVIDAYSRLESGVVNGRVVAVP